MPEKNQNNYCVTSAEDSIQVLTNILSTYHLEIIRPQIEFAIHEVKKCIPQKPVRNPWSPNRCPTCDANLGGKCNDGYFQNPYYEFCPVCRQVLDYGS